MDKPNICFNTDCFRFEEETICKSCRYTNSCNGYQISATKQMLKTMQDSIIDKIKKITKTHNITIRNMQDIGLDFNVEIGEKIISKTGHNPCVPQKNGKAIYQGHICDFTNISIDKCLDDILEFLGR